MIAAQMSVAAFIFGIMDKIQERESKAATANLLQGLQVSSDDLTKALRRAQDEVGRIEDKLEKLSSTAEAFSKTVTASEAEIKQLTSNINARGESLSSTREQMASVIKESIAGLKAEVRQSSSANRKAFDTHLDELGANVESQLRSNAMLQNHLGSTTTNYYNSDSFYQPYSFGTSHFSVPIGHGLMYTTP